MATATINPFDFRKLIYKDGANDQQATENALRYGAENGLDRDQLLGLTNSALGTNFTGADLDRAIGSSTAYGNGSAAQQSGATTTYNSLGLRTIAPAPAPASSSASAPAPASGGLINTALNPDVTKRTAQQKGDLYAAYKASGLSDEEIRNIVTQQYGAQTDAVWAALTGMRGNAENTTFDDKTGVLRTAVQSGMTPAQVRQSVEAALGAQTDENWNALMRGAGLLGTRGATPVAAAPTPAAGGAGQVATYSPSLATPARDAVARGYDAATIGQLPVAQTERIVVDDNQTVQGRLRGLIAEESPILQQARARALQAMNARGLINSSMAMGAADSALYDAAVPIATADAGTFAQAARQNADAGNTNNRFNVETEANRQRYNADATNQSRAFGAQAFNTAELTNTGRIQEVNLANAGFQNSAAQFNAASQNTATQNALDRTQQTALQTSQQNFQRGENALDRTQQTALQSSQQNFQRSENALDRTQQTELQRLGQTFQASQAQLDRAQQIMLADKSITAQQALQQSQQEFQRGESALDRNQQTELQKATQTFQATQAEKDRAAQFMLADKNISAQQAIELSRQSFQSEQAGLDRRQAVELATASRTFQADQAERERAQQIMLTDKQITAQKALQISQQSFQSEQAGLDRTQAITLATQAQNFQAKQNEVDRAQQLMLADKNINAQQALQKSQQDFAEVQSKLDRDFNAAQATINRTFQGAENELARAFNEKMQKIGFDQQSSLTAKNFAANQAAALNSQTAAILADPNLEPAAKNSAIANLVKATNATLEWASKFYGAEMPTVPTIGGQSSAPTSTANVVTSAGQRLTNEQQQELTYLFGPDGPLSGSSPEAQGYFTRNPDVLKEYTTKVKGSMTPDEYVAFHFDRYGRAEGRQAPGGL